MDLKTRLRLHRLTRAVYLSDSEQAPVAPRSVLLLPSRWSALVLVCVIGLLGVLGLSRAIGADMYGTEDTQSASTRPVPSEAIQEESPESGYAHPSSVQATLLVHVAGAVASPGVVRVLPGARAIDAIDAAGGALSDSDVDALNLAALVTDGERLYIPRIGEQLQTGEGGASGASSAVAHPSCVDLNTADASMLQTLDGIGPALADRIMNFRRSSGPFSSLDDLDAVPGIGPALLSRIAPGVCS